MKINDHISEWKTMERGCPQDTALGPLLWTVCQNDMSHHVNDSNLTMYAEDYQL